MLRSESAAGTAGGGVNAAHTAAVTKRKIRHGQCFTWLYGLMEDERIQQMLSDLAETEPAELPADSSTSASKRTPSRN